MNPRVEHCNATELRFEKANGNKMEQRNALSEEKRTKHPASSKMIASSEHAETPPPRHLMNPISTDQLARFRKMVRRLPKKISFEHAWEIRQLHIFFKNSRETQEEIKAFFTEALTPSLKVTLIVALNAYIKLTTKCLILGLIYSSKVF